MKSQKKNIPQFAKNYDHQKIEPKWRKIWDKTGLNDTPDKTDKPKFYILDMFPYPSGQGLHVGHPRGYIATDVYSRYKKMHGFNVLHPMGWDAFGLPAENYAIKNKTNPVAQTVLNVKRYKEQMEMIGLNYDWNREVNTTDPNYYKWTQWIFIQLLKKGLAYESFAPINWCPSCKTGLANEDLENGKCERCGSDIEKKPMRQWVLKITDYADRLLRDIDGLNWPESIKESQRNWIGRSEGMIFTSPVKGMDLELQTFSAHFEAFAADTFVVIAPDHPLLKDLVKGTPDEKKVLDFAQEIISRRNADKFGEDKEIEGIFTGRYTIDPVGNGELPIWVASYALADYGTGIVKCSAHDERDFAFAKKYNIKLKEVLQPLFVRREGEDAFHEDSPGIERDSVVCIIKHWSEDKYLCLDWKKVEWRGFVIGRIETGEKIEEAALREVREETGYKNAKFIKSFPSVHSKFFQPVKKVNRFAHFHPVYIELIDSAKDEVAIEEKELHDAVWVSKNEVEKSLKRDDMAFIWRRFVSEPFPWVDMKNAILTEPKEFAGKICGTLREEIKVYLEKNNLAKRKTTYRLKDWVFSRQRYWGEPIPVVHCEKCGIVPVPESELPVILPKVKFYEPTGTGESPLANIEKWVNTKCPKCVAEKNKTKYLIFDFDGVLADTFNETIHAHSIIHGINLAEAQKKMMKYFSNLPHHTRASVRTKEEIAEDFDFSQKFGQLILDSKFKLFAGFIREIQKYKNAKIAVVSSGSRKYVVPAIKKSGLKTSHILAFEDHHSKEEKIEKVCKDWGIDIGEAYYFTDTKADVYELQNMLAPGKLIGCAWGFQGLEGLKEVLPERQILKDFKDLHRILNLDCKAKRETNTMPQWAGSSWYYLRYMDPKNSKALVDSKKEKYWAPVDLYVGGTEHATRHLIYARFWHKFLHDIGVVSTSEPFMQLKNQGMILGSDNRKMSKRWGNVVNPDEVVKNVGADTLRVYEMFMGPFDQEISWSTDNMVGSRRFLERVWKLQEKVSDTKSQVEDKNFEMLLHRTIKKVTEDILGFNFNTVISALMILINAAEKAELSRDNYEIILKLLAPFAPHMTEEIWANLGNKKSIHVHNWPDFDAKKIVSDNVTVVVQINGKPRANFEVALGTSQSDVEKIAYALPEVSKWLAGKQIKKVMFIKEKILSIITD